MTKDLPPQTTLSKDHVEAIQECADEVWSLLKNPHWRMQDDDRSFASMYAARAEEAARLIAAMLR